MTSNSEENESSLLAQGDLLLKQLAEEAAAARAQAKHTELQRHMEEARKGNLSPLQEWLGEHSSSDPGRESPQHRADSVLEEVSSTESLVSFSSWEPMRAKAVDRLRVRLHPRHSAQSQGVEGSKLRPSTSDSETLSDSKTLSDPKSVQATNGRDAGRKVTAELAVDPSRKKPAQPATTKSPKANTSATKPAAEIQKLAKAIGQGDAHDEDRQALRKRGALFSRLSGAVTSAVAHLLLIAVLALITLQAPKAPAGMSFAAASSTPEEQVELTQPVDIESPDVSEPTTETEVSADLDFADTIQAAAPSDSLGNLGPVGDALSSTALSSAMQSMSAPAMSGANFFGASAGGNCFCYVIDGSGSMRGGPWEAAKFELFKSLDSMTEKQRFYIIFFGRDFEAISMPGEREPAKRALYANRENVAHAKQWVNGLDFVPGGPPIDAIEFAIEKEPDAIYLLTDGVTSVKSVAQQIRAANVVDDLINGEQVRSPIHAISFYSLEGEQLMRQIASENKGQFIYVPDPRKR